METLSNVAPRASHTAATFYATKARLLSYRQSLQSLHGSGVVYDAFARGSILAYARKWVHACRQREDATTTAQIGDLVAVRMRYTCLD